jgi:endo-1,3-1,4-beta-glycanase ExoK
MEQEPSPTPDRLSRDARTPSRRVAVLAALIGIAVVVTGWLAVKAYTEFRANEQRAIAAREHPSQQTPEAIAALPEPGPVADPEASATPVPAAEGPVRLKQQGKAFVDRFEGEGLSDRWFVSDGWSNGSWMANDWRSSTIETTSDGVAIHLRKAPEGSEYELAGGEFRTHAFYRYGYFEIRMKVPRDPGVLIGVFTYADRTDEVRPNEIDIEILGRATRVAELTIHENGRSTSKKFTLPFDSAEDFHTYGFDWQPEYVRWYADGSLIHEVTGPAARNLVRPQQFIVSLWASRELREWVGDLDISRAPWRMDVSCVAYSPTYSGPLCD